MNIRIKKLRDVDDKIDNLLSSISTSITAGVLLYPDEVLKDVLAIKESFQHVKSEVRAKKRAKRNKNITKLIEQERNG